MDEPTRQSILDEEHLRLLRIAYFVQGGITVFFSLFGLMYVFMGLLVSSMPVPNAAGAGPPPRFVGIIFALFGSAFLVAGAIFAVLQFLAAQGLGRRARERFAWLPQQFRASSFHMEPCLESVHSWFSAGPALARCFRRMLHRREGRQ